MAMIRIFDINDKAFDSGGIVSIRPLKSMETKKKSLNGWFVEIEVDIEYQEYIKQDMLVVVKTKSKINPQAFRIKNPKVVNNRISFKADHIMFDSINYFLLDVRPTAMSAIAALNYVNDRVDSPSPFNYTSNVSAVITAYFIRKSLFESWQIIEERSGGYFDADNFNISFTTTLGTDKGVTINYGVDLEGFETFEDWSSVVTKLYPVGFDGIMLPQKFIESEIRYEIPYSKTVSFETKIDQEDQTEENMLQELLVNAEEYLNINQFPKVSYRVKSDVQQDLEIGDLIEVKHPYVSIFTNVQEYTYDLMNNFTRSLAFGNYQRDLKSKFDGIKDDIKNALEKANIAEVITKEQTDLINSMFKDGHVIIDENEILILDKLPKETAVNVWRWNMGGLGFSNSGYEGPFDFAFTQDGKFNSSFIVAGSIVTNMLHSDVGSSLDISSNESIIQTVVDLQDQNERISQSEQTLEGFRDTVYSKTETNELMNETVATATEGWSNTYSKSGGANLIQNSSLAFGRENEYHFWDGDLKRVEEVDAVSGFASLLQVGIVTQHIINVAKGFVSLRFNYKKIGTGLDPKMQFKINEDIYDLLEENGTVEISFESSSGIVDLSFMTDTSDQFSIYDLMFNYGEDIYLKYQQAYNETDTGTVKISKDITVESNLSNTTTVIGANGLEGYNKTTGSIIFKLTDSGSIVAHLDAESANIGGLTIKRVGNQIWLVGG